MRMILMSTINYGWAYNTDFPFTDKELETIYEEYAIGGKMITVNYTSNASDEMAFSSLDNWQNFVKDKLAHAIGRAMISGKLISFDLQKDMAESTTHYRARCYVAPDDQVRLLKALKKK